jgi:flagellar basal body rod protein FlgC
VSVGRIGQSGADLQSLRLFVSGHNTANQNTNGFTASRVVAVESATGGVRGKVEPSPTRAPDYFQHGDLLRPSTTSPIEEAVTRKTALAAYRANLATVRAEDEAYRSLLDAVG